MKEWNAVMFLMVVAFNFLFLVVYIGGRMALAVAGTK